jgi:hypothetical protein
MYYFLYDSRADDLRTRVTNEKSRYGKGKPADWQEPHDRPKANNNNKEDVTNVNNNNNNKLNSPYNNKYPTWLILLLLLPLLLPPPLPLLCLLP